MFTRRFLRFSFYFSVFGLILFIVFSPDFPMDMFEGLLIFAVIFFVGSFVESKRQLKNQHKFIIEIFDYIPDAMFLLDKKHRFMASNDIFLDMLKIRNKKKIKGRTYYDFLERDVADELIEINNKIFQKKYGVSYIKRINFDECEKIFDVRKIPFVVNDEPEGIITLARDITQEKLLEQQLNERQFQMHSLLNNIDSIVYLKDREGRVVIGNRKFEEFMHLKLEDIIGKSLCIADNDITSMDKEVIEERKTVSQEKEVLTLDGKKWMEFRKSPVVDEYGNVFGITVLVHDISERKTIEKYLLQTQEEAIHANKLKSELIANVSHEIRTPIGGIIGFLELLNLSIKDEKPKRLLSNAMKSSRHLLKLIDSLLDFSKIETGGIELSCSSFCLRELVIEVLEEIKTRKNSKELDIELDFDENISPVLYGDALKLSRVFNNILDNAIKFTEYGRINFFCKMIEDTDYYSKIYFEITDTGIGVDEKIKDTIFDSFVQADSSITKKYEGVGLGLTICKHLLKIMGSEIHIESTKGVGTKVFFDVILRKTAIIREIHQTCLNIK